jgi:hypothetical protein
MVEPRVTDVEVLKKKARRMAAGQVLSGGSADIGLPLEQVRGCRVSIAAGYGALSEELQAQPGDRLLWILDGFVDITSASGQVTRVNQGESTVLPAQAAFRLVFPTLTIYLSVESPEAV